MNTDLILRTSRDLASSSLKHPDMYQMTVKFPDAPNRGLLFYIDTAQIGYTDSLCDIAIFNNGDEYYLVEDGPSWSLYHDDHPVNVPNELLGLYQMAVSIAMRVSATSTLDVPDHFEFLGNFFYTFISYFEANNCLVTVERDGRTTKTLYKTGKS